MKVDVFIYLTFLSFHFPDILIIIYHKSIANRFIFYKILSRPLLVISIATAFNDQSERSDGPTDCHSDSPGSEVCSESSSVQADSHTR